MAYLQNIKYFITKILARRIMRAKFSFYSVIIFALLNISIAANVYATSILNNCPVTESSIFNKAGDFYKEGKYDEAIAEYKIIEKTGFESGNLYFNLGNCYFKKAKLGEAILYYEKAKKLLPRDSDLKLNFELAKSRVSGYTIALKQTFFSKIAGLLFQELTIDELMILMSMCFIGCLGILLMWFFRPALCAYLRPIIFIFTVFFIFGCVSLTDKISFNGNEAIILTPQVQVRFEPFKKATIFFELAQGTKVEVLQQKENWVKIKRRDGKTGWTTQQSLGYI